MPLRFTSQFARAVLLSLLSTALLATAICAGTTKKPPLHPININSANSEELQQVPGIGPATADKILQMRRSYGPFKSVDDLLAIRGIGPKRLEKMRKYLTAGKSSSASPKKSAEEHPATCTACKKTAPPWKPATLTHPKEIPAEKTTEPASPEAKSEDEEPE